MINLGKYLYNKFPDLYLSEDSRQGYALKRFFEVLGGGFDEQERYIADFSNIHNVDLCPAPLLPLLAEQYGFEFPYDMDEATQRKFIKVIPFLYQYKGTDRAFKYLAREIFGEGTVTNTYTLSPPAGVSWEEWISDPSTQQDWQKLFVRLEVNGETLFLDDRATNFAKFSELIRPANKRVVPNLVLFYQDIRDSSLSQEMYDLITVKDNYGTFSYRFRDGSDKIGEQQLVDKLKFTEEEPYDRTRISDFLREFKLGQGELSDSDYRLNNYGLIDYLKVNPEYETRTAIMYDEHKLDNPMTTDEEIRPNTLDDSKETLFKLKDTSEDISTAVRDDSVNTEKTTITDTDIRDKVIDDSVDKWTINAGVDTDSFNSAGVIEAYTRDTNKETFTDTRNPVETMADAPNNNFTLKFAKLNSFSFGLGYRGQTEGVKYDDGMETLKTYVEEEGTAIIKVDTDNDAYSTSKMQDATASGVISVTRTTSTLKTLNKLVTGFRLTDFVPVTTTFAY